MGKKLVIAEKPSVALDLARALGKVPRVKDYFENDDYVITSAVGHLVELCLPGELDKKRGKWSFANLPIIPDHFELKPISKNETRFKLIKRLLRRKDIDEIINACDAGREGELIFQYIIQLSGVEKPTRRLWLQSMTMGAIQEGFRTLRQDKDMVPLANAAVCRSESDWLVGINATRAMTAFNSQDGGFQLTPVGRVQTPTLTVLVEREEKIRAFEPKDYWEVFADFGVRAGSYRGRWFDEKFQKNDDEHRKAERIWEEEKAAAIRSQCEGKIGEIEEQKKPASQAAPLLYDLTTLQREANARFGFSARRTLQLAQALYERYKLLTYPRTDSRYLPEDNLPIVKGNMTKFANVELARHAEKALSEGWVRPNKRIFNNAKVSDHHAIIPTGAVPKDTLGEAEAKLYDMVARRSIAVFYPPVRFEVTTRITRVEGHAFKTDGRVITDPGWQAVYGKQASGSDNENLVTIEDDEKAQVEELEVKLNQTKPPARFNESTLLSAMEGAGKLVDDEELREAMSQRGLGTPATRAQVIEGLLREGYVIRQGRDLIVTAKGISLIRLLHGIGIESLTSPEMTGEWEYQLKRMELGETSRPDFMAKIRSFTDDIVTKAKNFSGEIINANFENIETTCPKCGNGVFKETFKAFECTECKMLIWKNMAGRELEREEIATLLQKKSVGPLEGFRSRLGRLFNATVKLDEEFKQQFDFGDAEENSAEGLDFSKLPVLGKCPSCKDGQVYDIGSAFCCNNASGQKKTCTFRIGKVILQRDIPQEQVKKLMEAGRTDLLPRFISKKGRPFSAYLKQEKGKVVFEFEPRKTAAKKTAKKSVKKAAAKKA
ncbi:MAG: DNA topoisomerase III [Chthoniobacterales bacterium]